MASRKIEDLRPDLQPVALEFLRRCTALEVNGVDIIFTCTYRSNDEQAALYASGRTKPGPILTHAEPGVSAHNFTLNGKPAARAFDYGVIVNGKYDAQGVHPAWAQAGRIAMELGLNWYGKPGAKFREMPHCELKKGA